MLDIASFSRYEVTGPEAESWLDWMTVSRLPKPGRARLAPMLSETGKLKGDLTVINWGDGTFWIEGSYYLRQWHMRWFADHAREGVSVRDISDDVIGFSLSGPKSRELLARVTHQDVSNAALPFMGAATLDVGLVRAKVARLSVTGELGYEINCRALEHAGAAQDPARGRTGARRQGVRLQRAPVAEARKELRHLVGRVHSGLYPAHDRHGPLDRLGQGRVYRPEGGARGEQGSAAGAPAGHARNRRGRCGRNRLRAGLAFGKHGRLRDLGRLWPHVGKSLAMALVAPEAAEVGSELSVHIVGAERKARVIAPSPYDPARQGDAGMTSKAPAAS